VTPLAPRLLVVLISFTDVLPVQVNSIPGNLQEINNLRGEGVDLVMSKGSHEVGPATNGPDKLLPVRAAPVENARNDQALPLVVATNILQHILYRCESFTLGKRLAVPGFILRAIPVWVRVQGQVGIVHHIDILEIPGGARLPILDVATDLKGLGHRRGRAKKRWHQRAANRH